MARRFLTALAACTLGTAALITPANAGQEPPDQSTAAPAAATRIGPAVHDRTDTTDTCPTQRWDGANLAGEDLAYRVDAPPRDSKAGTNVRCFVAHRSIEASKDEPVYLSSGIQMDNTVRKPGQGERKSFIIVQLMCFDENGTAVFRNNAGTNIHNGVKGPTGYYPRAVFSPPADGTYDCGVRAVNWKMGDGERGAVPLPVYAVRGYVNADHSFALTKQNGSTIPGNPEDLRTGELVSFLPKGSRTTLRQTVATVPEGVDRLTTSTTVNYTKCAWGDEFDDKKICNEGSWDSPRNESLHWLRIVAWQPYAGNSDPGERCAVLAEPDAPVAARRVSGDRHHRTQTLTSDLTLSDNPECARRVVVRTVIEMNNDADYDAGWVHGQNTVLSVFA